MVSISKSYSDTVGQKVPYIHEMEMCCQRGSILHGPTLELIHHCGWLLGLREEKSKELLPYKGGVYFYTPAVFSCLQSWCLLRSVTELREGFVEGSTQVCVAGSSTLQEHWRAAAEQSGLPSWIQLNLWARPAADASWQDKAGKSPGRGDTLPLKPWILPAALRGGWRCY